MKGIWGIAIGLQLLMGLLIFTLLSIYNLGYAREFVPSYLIIICLWLYLSYQWVLILIFWYIWKGLWAEKLLAFALYITLTLTLIPTLSYLIHDLLPSWDIYFYDYNSDENPRNFAIRIWRSYFVVHGMAVIHLIIVAYVRKEMENRSISKELKMYIANAQEHRYTDHFLGNIFNTSFGAMLREETLKTKQAKMDVIQFLAYVQHINGLKLLVQWEEELDQLHCFIRLLKYRYADAAIQVDIADMDTLQEPIPKGLLFFPLENCLKHALIAVDYPISYSIQQQEGQVQIRCHNYCLDKQQPSTNTGYSLLQEKIKQSVYPIDVKRDMFGNEYELRMTISYKSYEKSTV